MRGRFMRLGRWKQRDVVWLVDVVRGPAPGLRPPPAEFKPSRRRSGGSYEAQNGRSPDRKNQ